MEGATNRQSRAHSDKTLFFLGDSHVLTVQDAFERNCFPGRQARFVAVGGATAVGLRHPVSKTQALAHFRRRLLPRRTGVIPIFQIGEVDCGFVMWVRAEKNGEPIAEQVDQSVRAYGAFLHDIRQAGYQRVVATSAVLPTILDGQLDGEVAQLRKQVRATLQERTQLTLQYNESLRSAAESAGAHFLDLTPYLINPKTGLIDDRFRHPDRNNHHLHPVTGGNMWAEAIERLLERI
jgi:hypothetical protein